MLPGQELNLDEFVIDRELVSSDGQWQVRAL
jgi:ATP phosphoribosyltransferase regulatory subunit